VRDVFLPDFVVTVTFTEQVPRFRFFTEVPFNFREEDATVSEVFEPFGAGSLLRLKSVFELVVAFALITFVYLGVAGVGETICEF
jgi:hypothetical protein